jgi:oligoribonuclease NrnB/cAMP/cGMP phosphodiesterase (DHH superfamily)
VDKWTAIIQQSDATLRAICQEDHGFLLFHDDADGCCAAAILLNLFTLHAAPTIKKAVSYASPETHSVEITPRLEQKLREEKPTHIVSVDLALSETHQRLGTLLTSLGARMLAYDHHIQSTSLIWPERCTHINPLNHNLGNIPASYYSHILHQHYTQKASSLWVAATGVVADYRTSECHDLIRKVKRQYPYLYPFATVDQPTALRSPLLTMGHLVNAGYQHSDHHGAKIAVEALQEALDLKDPRILLDGKTEKTRLLHKYRLEVDQDLKTHLDRFSAKADFPLDSKLAIYAIYPKFNISSQIATELQHSNPSTIIAVISPETETTLKVSLRKGVNVDTDLSLLAELTTSNLEGATGGGHRDAAGCIIRKQDVTRWKDALLNVLTQSGVQPKSNQT